MLIYRSDDEVVETAPALDRLIDRVATLNDPTHDQVTSVFIDLGELESAIDDRLFPDADGIHPLAQAWRSAAVSAAHVLISSWRKEIDRRDRAIELLHRKLTSLPRHLLPSAASKRVSEGYAFYALRPETYVAAAEQWVADTRVSSAVCIGIRSIGTSLSAAVAAGVERHRVAVATYTVRPRGHPFDRQLSLADALGARLQAQPDDACFLIVDEGPGLSGSSFASVVRALRRLGIAGDRIMLFPSSNADGSSFLSDSARATWNDHRRYCVSAREAHCSIEHATGDSTGIDISAGRWRQIFSHPTTPAVHPQHEVVKRWLPDTMSILRFAGLGRYGELKLNRAEQLAECGLGPAPQRLENGYLWLTFLEATPWDEPCEALIDAIARHCATLNRLFAAKRSPPIDDVFEMVATNVKEGCGDLLTVPGLERFRTALSAAPTAAIDGRMLAHEWLLSKGTFIKVDALDHSQNHFFPGIQDAGWDLAASAFEFDLDDGGRRRLIERYVAESRDKDVRWRMPFYDIAYPAFRLGYAVMAAQSLGDTADGARFRGIAERCRTRLAQVAGS